MGKNIPSLLVPHSNANTAIFCVVRKGSGFYPSDSASSNQSRAYAVASGHYMKAGMLNSQLEILEELGADEYGVKIDNPGSPEAVEADIVNWVKAQGLI